MSTILNKHYIYISVYFLLILIIAPTNLLHFDSYYYWDWSRHLALSYYDGPPMIAYFIKASTLIFGDTLFALSIVGITVCALTSFLIYKTANLFLTKEASYVAMMIWLFSPAVYLDLLQQTTYDAPLTLFWALTLYFTVQFITYNKTKYLYLTAISIGLMMLSKYSGIILVLSILIFLISTPYRRLFKQIHLYAAMLLSIVIFSPVLFWNYQHQWISFLYQLHEHQLPPSTNAWINIAQSMLAQFIPMLNFILAVPLFLWIKSAHKKIPAVYLCWVICITFFCFYLWTAKYAVLHPLWLTQYIITAALLVGFCFQQWPKIRKLIYCLIAVYWLLSIIFMLFQHYKVSSLNSKKNAYYQLMQHFNDPGRHLPDTIVTSNWMAGRMLFFLKNKPKFYTLPACGQENQYALWSTDIVKRIADKSIHEVLYIDIEDNIQCVQKYFKQCSLFEKKFSYDWYRSHHQSFFGYYSYYCTF